MVHDDRSREGFPDAGGFPSIKPQRSLKPLRLVRDLTFRVRLKGTDVPANAGAIEVAWCPPGGISSSDPMGTPTPPTVSASAAIPAGTFDAKWIAVKLPATDWLKAITAAAAKDPKDAAESAKAGPVLPGTARVTIRTTAKTGRVEVEAAELLAAGAEGPNLLPNGGFEVEGAGLPAAGWSVPAKYRYFPPAHYYIFNTWHNSTFKNRGSVEGDSLVVHSGRRSERMSVPPGDEKCIVSKPIAFPQKEPRLIEVSAWVKTDRLAMLQIDAVNEKGERLDGFNFIHKAPMSDRHRRLAAAAASISAACAGEVAATAALCPRRQWLHARRHRHPAAEQRRRNGLVGRRASHRAGEHRGRVGGPRRQAGNG